MSERPFTLSCCDTEIVWKDAENNVRQWMYRLRFSSREMQQGPIGLFYDEDGVLVIESPDNLICARIKGHYLAWRDGLVARFKHTPSQSSPDEALMGVGQSDVLVVGSEMVFRDSSGNILATAPFSNYSTGTTLVDPQGGTYTVSSKDGRLRATIDGDCIVRWCFKLTEHEVVNGRGFEHGYIRVMDEATREDIRADEEATQRIYRERNDELRASLGMPRLWSP